MDKRIAGLLGGVAAFTTLGTAQAAAPAANAGGALSAQSYADLLTWSSYKKFHPPYDGTRKSTNLPERNS